MLPLPRRGRRARLQRVDALRKREQLRAAVRLRLGICAHRGRHLLAHLRQAVLHLLRAQA